MELAKVEVVKLCMYGKAKLYSSEMTVTLYRKKIPIIRLFNEHTFPPDPEFHRSIKMLDKHK